MKRSATAYQTEKKGGFTDWERALKFRRGPWAAEARESGQHQEDIEQRSSPRSDGRKTPEKRQETAGKERVEQRLGKPEKSTVPLPTSFPSVAIK